MSTREPSCPICRKPVTGGRENPTYPFCCERCRLVDLGNWLGEAYAIPDEPTKEPGRDD